MSPHATVSTSLADRLEDLGGIQADRVRLTPGPGKATIEDLIANNESSERLCELVDQTLVEKAMSYEASVVALAIAELIRQFVRPAKLGLVSGPDGMFRLLESSTRGPDVAFLHRNRLPDGKFPTEPYPSLAPNLAVEVLSPGNTKAEMSRKRIEFFHSGVQLVWIVDCRHRSVAVYKSPDQAIVLGEEETIDGGSALPGFSCQVGEFFADLDLQSTSQ